MRPITPSEIKELKRIGSELKAAAKTVTRLESELESFLNRHGSFNRASVSNSLWAEIGRIEDVTARLEVSVV